MYRVKVVERNSVTCMTLINPKACKQSPIQIEIEQRDEGPIPHVHVYLDKTANPKNCAYIRLDKAEYSPHHNGKKLNKKQKKAFIDIMSNVWPKRYIQSIYSDEIKEATGYEMAVDIWIETYGETVPFTFSTDGYPVMPDYSQL